MVIRAVQVSMLRAWRHNPSTAEGAPAVARVRSLPGPVVWSENLTSEKPYFSVISNAISALPAPHHPLRTSYNKDMFCRVHLLPLLFVVLSAGLLRAGTA